MIKHFKCVKWLLLAALCTVLLTACKDNKTTATPTPAEVIDYASQVKLDMNSETKKQVVTVKNYVDGDTTHFYVPTSVSEDGVLKARYLAVNTPESTGKIEPYGKKASRFTKEKLSNASSIIVESDDANWNLDSTSSRFLVWVWYRNSETEEYRNLNIEILQNGLAIASSSANNRYGSVCTAALSSAKEQKLNVHSGQADPDLWAGDAVECTLKEIRTNIASYNGVKVAFEGGIAKNSSNGVYVEEYDPETDMYYGIYVYYGFNLSGEGLEVLTVGNRSRIVGTVQLYETAGTYQVSGLTYRQMKPDDPGNIKKLGDGYEAAFVAVTPEQFANGKVTVESEDSKKEFKFSELALDTTVSMKNLQVVDIYTTSNEDSSSYGAMTMTCKSGDTVITVRTVVLYDENKNMITAEKYLNKNIDIKGIVSVFNGEYQIKVLSAKDITIN